jgi:hypothetical protein
MFLPDDQQATITPDGHYLGTDRIEDMLLYIAIDDTGKEHRLTPAEFSAKFGWKNDPTKVTLMAQPKTK